MVEMFQFARFARTTFVLAYSQFEEHIKRRAKSTRLSGEVYRIIRAYHRESWPVSGDNIWSRGTGLGHQPTQDDHQKQ